MAQVGIRYWASVRAAAGVERDEVAAGTVAEALDAARRLHPGPEFARVLGLCSLLRNGVRVSDEQRHEPLTGDVEIEALPPFAGG